MAPVANKIEQKVKLVMDPMLQTLWKSKEYSTPTKESVSLVGKSTGMPGTTSGGFTPQTTGVS